MNKKKILFAILVIIFGVIFRIFLNQKIGLPNFEAVTALSLLSGFHFGGLFAQIMPFSIIFLSDIFFGNTTIHIFTWSAFILIGTSGALLRKKTKTSFLKITSFGLLSVIFFYLWTNFGWWLISKMYQMNFKGLIDSYVAGIPFLKNQLFSTLIFVPCFHYIFSFIRDNVLNPKEKKNKNINLQTLNP